MQFNEIKKIHKEIQKRAKKEKSVTNKVFIRHWNVFYNQVRGRDLSLIEKFSRTQLYNNFLSEIAQLTNFGQFKPHETEYSSNSEYDYKWVTSSSVSSSLWNYLKEETKEEVKND